MMKTIVAATALILAGAFGAQADSHLGGGDPAAGEKEFSKCKSCHMIVADDGTEIVKGGKTGPNLYGVIGHQAGSVEGFKYGADLVKAGEAGLVWDQETFVAWVQDPKAFLVDRLGDSGARSKMSFKLKKGMDDVYAYLVSVGPEMTQ